MTASLVLRAALLLSCLDSGAHVHEADVLVFKVRRVRLYPAGTNGRPGIPGPHGVQLSGQEWGGRLDGGIEVSVCATAVRVVQPAAAEAAEQRARDAALKA